MMAMAYETVGILASIILVIINQDVLWNPDENAAPSERAYRRFLLGILAFYVIDILWGILDSMHFIEALYVDTIVYFVIMCIVVHLWAQYVTAYLEIIGTAKKVLTFIGIAFLAFGIMALAINLVEPIFFWFDAAGVYHGGFARYLYFGFQMMLFLLTSVYTFWTITKVEGTMKPRHLAIGFFGISMAVLIGIQLYYPLLPLYSIGCMIGGCVLHTFVVEDEKEEYRRALEETLLREQLQEQELGSAKKLAYTDPLTNVKNKRAYNDEEARLNQRIANGTVKEFGIVVFDLNKLKYTNDTKGHEEGDRYLIASCKLICDTFKHSPVFRVGGDEFVVLLEGADYLNRAELLCSFNEQVDCNLHDGGPVVSAGMSEFDPSLDTSCWTIFDRADSEMYQRKSALKAVDGQEAQ